MHVEQLVGCRWNKRSDAVDYAVAAVDGQISGFPGNMRRHAGLPEIGDELGLS